MREIHLQNHLNHNNKHEGLNGGFRDRLKATRGLEDEKSALIGLMIIHHNFFREHSALDGRTPAEAAGITIEDIRAGGIRSSQTRRCPAHNRRREASAGDTAHDHNYMISNK